MMTDGKMLMKVIAWLRRVKAGTLAYRVKQRWKGSFKE